MKRFELDELEVPEHLEPQLEERPHWANVLVWIAFGGVLFELSLAGAILIFDRHGGEPDQVTWDGPRLPRSPNGRPDEVVEQNGSERCGWEGLRVLVVPAWVAWAASDTGYDLAFAPEKNGARGHEIDGLTGDFDGVAALPPDAVRTEYTDGDRQLWFASSDAGRYAYIVGEENVERWPRFDGGCD